MERPKFTKHYSIQALLSAFSIIHNLETTSIEHADVTNGLLSSLFSISAKSKRTMNLNILIIEEILP